MTERRTTERYVLGAACVALIAAAGCEERMERTERTEPPSVEAVAERPMTYEGRKVALSGEVDDVYDSRAFQLESDDDPFEIWEEELLVVTRSPIRMPGRAADGALEDDDEVVVTGTIRNFVVAELERELGWDLDPEIEAEFRNVPVLVADTVSRVEKQAYWSEAERDAPQIMSYTVITMTEPMKELAGSKVSLDYVPVRSVSKKGVWIGYIHTHPLFVAAPDTKSLEGLNTGDVVQVTGTLREMPPMDEAKQRFGTNEEMKEAMEESALFLEATELKKAFAAGEKSAATTTPATGDTEVTLADFARSPEQHSGQKVTGTAEVEKVISDRAFWLKTDNGRVLGIVREDVPRHEMIDIDAGQRLEFTAQAVSAQDAKQEIAGELDEDAKDALEGAVAVLDMHWRDVQIQKK